MKVILKSRDLPLIATMANDRIKTLSIQKESIQNDINNIEEDSTLKNYFSSDDKAAIKKYFQLKIESVDIEIEQLNTIYNNFTTQ